MVSSGCFNYLTIYPAVLVLTSVSQAIKFTNALEAGAVIILSAVFHKHPITVFKHKQFPDGSFKKLKGRPILVLRGNQRTKDMGAIIEEISTGFDVTLEEDMPGILSIRMNYPEIQQLQEGLMSRVIAALGFECDGYNGAAKGRINTTGLQLLQEGTPEEVPLDATEGYIKWNIITPVAPEGDEQDFMPMMAAEYNAIRHMMRILSAIWEHIVEAKEIQLALVELIRYDLVNLNYFVNEHMDGKYLWGEIPLT
jgi:hypothetical protein